MDPPQQVTIGPRTSSVVMSACRVNVAERHTTTASGRGGTLVILLQLASRLDNGLSEPARRVRLVQETPSFAFT